jgi:pectate lyase
VVERMPRVRFGQVHVFNNYYSAHGNSYAVGAAIQSRVRVENNVFDGVTDPHKFYLTSGETRSAEMFAAGNLYPNSTGKQDNDGSAFTPPYPYKLDPASDVAAIVMANAGPH